MISPAWIASLGSALALFAPVAVAQTPPEGLVWMALNDINGAYVDLDDPTNRPALVTTPPEGMLRAVEVNGDGRPDWLIDYSHAGMALFCGTGGCARRLYVSGGDTTYRRAFDAQALAFEVIERDGETRVEAQVHHLNCPPDRGECWFAWAWDVAAGRLVERPARDGTTILADGGFDPIDADRQRLPDDLPAELSQRWFGARLTCADHSDAGFTTQRPAFRQIPDVNADGRRDWLEFPPLCPEEGAETRFAVWATTSDGGLAEAYVSGVEMYPSVDIGSVPARVLAGPACGYGQACAPVRLRWEAGQGRLVPET